MSIRRSTKFNSSVSRALHGAPESSSENGYSLLFGENEGLTQTNNQAFIYGNRNTVLGRKRYTLECIIWRTHLHFRNLLCFVKNTAEIEEINPLMSNRRLTKFNTSVSRALRGASEASSENGYSLRFRENEGLTQTNNQAFIYGNRNSVLGRKRIPWSA
ncbi:hypothetical protein CDAR_192401 [Caerostris darwini]|uniref:Uncharacterized protein n=1 Tax=Caerostris darwini TaxID=1538125 RepID=A0AAV4PHB9_9ARAC|nr:hypothetical protein CDAR_192401 [Caerostris darwini]